MHLTVDLQCFANELSSELLVHIALCENLNEIMIMQSNQSLFATTCYLLLMLEKLINQNANQQTLL